MSRIHEALKRAEEERAGSSAPAADAGKPAEHIEEAAPIATAPDPAAAQEMITWDEFVARCPKAEWDPEKETVLFFQAKREKVGMEEFRVLRSRLYQMQEKTGLKKLLVTSALPKEGKSFISANLAQVLCHRNGRRALLVDADLRAPNLHHMFGIESSPGLSEYLRGEKDEFSVIHGGPMDGLFTVPAGSLVRNPAELATNGRLKDLFARVENLFDWIIIDSPPVPVAETGLLATYCDGVIMVVRAESTPFHIARKARRELEERFIVGVILNGIDPYNSPYTHYYYNYYSANKDKKHRHKGQKPARTVQVAS